ncbi:hypothetical protein DRO66_03765 [Candidatus Bathyarchaeota archaeon]|nr:MAG: hypothetical protein DRO66_03765 [Candidatus Bathyarchaeota archaeon]
MKNKKDWKGVCTFLIMLSIEGVLAFLVAGVCCSDIPFTLKYVAILIFVLLFGLVGFMIYDLSEQTGHKEERNEI